MGLASKSKPPTEFTSVEAMIGHYSVLVVKNHPLHRDKLGGGVSCSLFRYSAESRSPPTESRWGRLLPGRRPLSAIRGSFFWLQPEGSARRFPIPPFCLVSCTLVIESWM